MKKYIYSLCLLGVIVYSCKTQQATPVVTQTQPTESAPKKSDVLTIRDGENLFNLRCGKCHDLPKAAELTVAEWKPVITRMAPKAKLSADETSWILAYVNANAKK